jgi:hypothetical protein
MPIDMSNKSFAQDNRVAVSDDGLGVGTLSAGARAEALQNATSISTGLGSVNKLGSTEVIGSTVATQSVMGSNTGTINYGLGVSDVTKLLSDTTGGIANLVKQQSDAAAKTTTDVVSGLQDLALSKQTNGESARDNTILWVVGLGLAGLLALILGGKRG